MKGVFDSKPNSGYNDEVERYQFPKTKPYLEAAESLVGDWIVYREPKRNGGRKAYVAVARVTGVIDDPQKTTRAYAVMADYLPFDRPVPIFDNGSYWEESLRELDNPAGAGRSLQGRSLRTISDADFAAIVRAGLAETLDPDSAIRLGLAVGDVDRTAFDFSLDPAADHVRRIEQILVNRKIRDANFRRQVCDAYEDRCAVTGLKIVNGGGRSEVQAAHIWGVAEGGPDVVQNGLALSGTVHWLFDRHLISLTDDYKILLSHNKVPSELRSLFEHQMERINLPDNPALWPHPVYIGRHRQAFLSH